MSVGGAVSADVTCLIEPYSTVRLSTPVEGIVADVRVDRGDAVRRGDVVAHLDAEVIEATVAVAAARASNTHSVRAREANLAFVEAQRERHERLRRTNAIAEAALQEVAMQAAIALEELGEARLALELARLELRQQEAALRQRRIVSPIDGVVVERLLNPGEYRNEQAHVVTIAQLDPLRIEAFLPIARYGEVAVGDVAWVEPEAPVGGSYEARVTIVDRVLDAASGTFGVRLELPNPEGHLPAGLRCEIRF